MKNSIKLLAGASMAVFGIPALTMMPAVAASGPFADVPADHWAYDSVDTLQKAGIVIGYPDGTYGGKRAMTRYEFAVAIARLMPLLKVDTSNLATKDDLDALRQDLQSKLAANQDAIDALKKLMNEFQPELQKLGQDVAAADARLDNLEGRMAAVEAEQARVRFTGVANFIARGDLLRKGPSFTDKNGVRSNANSKHLLATDDVYHDFVLNVDGKVSDTATAHVALDFGNYLAALGNTAAAGNTGAFEGMNGGITPGTNVAGNQQTTLWEAYLNAPVSLGPLGGANVTIGRFGNQWTKYTLMQTNSDVYTSLYQTDSGNIIGDGIKANLKIGPAKVSTFATKLSATPFSQVFGGSVAGGANTRPLGSIASNHAAPFDQGAGIRATFGNPESAVFGVTLEQFGLNRNGQINPAGPGSPTDPNRQVPIGLTQSQYNRLSVYGVDFNGDLPFFKKTGLTLDANYTVSAHGVGNGFNNVGNSYQYSSTDDQLGFHVGALTLKGGYQYVGPEFSAPGYWGKIGSWTNPTNIRGGVGSLKYAFTPKLSLDADVENYTAAYGLTKQGFPINSPLQGGDHLNRYQIGLKYGLTAANTVDLGYEHVEYDLKNNNFKAGLGSPLNAAGKPTESYITLGLGHDINPNTSFKFLYQIVQYDDKNTGFDPSAALGKTEGGVAVGQVSIKF